MKFIKRLFGRGEPKTKTEGYKSDPGSQEMEWTGEESRQKKVAENPDWLLAKKNEINRDSRKTLEELGFQILEEDKLFYKVKPPEGYTRSTEGYWTKISDERGRLVFEQFFKAAEWDTRAEIRKVLLDEVYLDKEIYKNIEKRTRVKDHLIALDLRAAIRAISEGLVDEDEIHAIISNRVFPPEELDEIIKRYRFLDWEENPDLCEEIFRRMLNQGKIKQPNVRFYQEGSTDGKWIKKDNFGEWVSTKIKKEDLDEKDKDRLINSL